MSDAISESLGEALTRTCRTAIGDRLRSIVVGERGVFVTTDLLTIARFEAVVTAVQDVLAGRDA